MNLVVMAIASLLDAKVGMPAITDNLAGNFDLYWQPERVSFRNLDRTHAGYAA